MKAVMRLTYLHFAAGSWRRWFLLVGVTTIIPCLFYPPTMDRWAYLPAIAFAGITAFFLGSTLMPLHLFRLSRSRIGCLLPYGRPKLIISAFLTTFIVSSPAPIISALVMRATFPYYTSMPFFEYLQTPVFLHMYMLVFLLCSWLYFILWLGTSAKSAKDTILAMIVLLGIGVLPKKFLAINTETTILASLLVVMATWSALALYVLYRPTILHVWRQLSASQHWLVARQIGKSAIAAGQETQMCLGIGNRWIHVVAIAAVIALDALFVRGHGAWLFFLAQLAILTGVISGVTPVRSRLLWLRRPWLRDELFAQVELFQWRHMGPSVLVVLAWFVAVGVYASVPLARLVASVSLLALIFTVCLYLGFMQTRGMRWPDAIFAIVVAMAAVLSTVYVARPDTDLAAVVTIEFVLAALSVVFRLIAKKRWVQIDWMLCKPSRAA